MFRLWFFKCESWIYTKFKTLFQLRVYWFGKACYTAWGDVAQMVERSLSMWEVKGSMPFFSKNENSMIFFISRNKLALKTIQWKLMRAFNPWNSGKFKKDLSCFIILSSIHSKCMKTLNHKCRIYINEQY